MARLCCQLSKVEPGAPVQWLKEDVELHAGPKYEMHYQGATCELLIHGLEAKDTGEYACVVSGQKTLASVKVRGEHSCHTHSSIAALGDSLSPGVVPGVALRSLGLQALPSHFCTTSLSTVGK